MPAVTYSRSGIEPLRAPQGPDGSAGRDITALLARLGRMLALVAACLFLAQMVVGREGVVRVVPDLAGLYALVGMPVNLTGLQYEDVNAQRTALGSGADDDAARLEISGDVRNVSSQTLEPKLVAVLEDARGRPLAVVPLVIERHAGRERLGPGEVFGFSGALDSPPQKARRILVRQAVL